MNQETKQRKAVANLDSMRRVFSIPENADSTLSRIEEEISKNLLGFLRNNIVAGEMEPEDLEKDFQNIKIPDDPMFVSQHAEFLLEKVVKQSVHTASPSFIGHMTSSMPYFMLPLAKIMIALNQNTVKIETSKAFTPLEALVIGMLHRLVFQNDDDFYRKWTHNHEHAFGVFTSGGTTANMTGLWVARNRLLTPKGSFKSVGEDGLHLGLKVHDLNGLAILVSKRGHYSLKKAADILGIGRSNLIAIETDQLQKCKIDKLKATISKLKQEKIGIISIVGIAGTTETGSVDPLSEMAKIAKDEGIHFHVDGAWGAPTLFSDKHQHLLKGIELADSVVIDAHKQLYVPMGAGMCLFRDVTALDCIQTNAQYIIRKGSRDLGKHTLEGSRPGMAMLVHSGLQVLGKKGYELLIDLGIAKAQQFAKLIQCNDNFELTSAPELNLLTYRYRPSELKVHLQSSNSPIEKIIAINMLLNELTVNIQKTQRDRGKTFVSRTSFEMPLYDQQILTVFRCVLANPLTTRQILADILLEQEMIAKEEMIKMDFQTKIIEVSKRYH